MNPLSALFGAAVGIRNQLYDRGMMTVNRLQGPVVSIGNLTVGGSGKTPFLILLGELLKQRSIGFDVLSRGYRRQTRGIALVDTAGSPREFGDEPLLIARKLGAHVVVGEDRYQAGQLAEEMFGPQLHLLDDGFQHRALARDFDIVLVTSEDAQDALLPVGRLREPLASLSRADVVVLTNDASRDGLGLTKQHVWRVRRDIVPPQTSEACIAFCGISRPESFFGQLRASGVSVVANRSFRDHHFYTKADIRGLTELRKQHSAAAFVTTEKDAVNLGSQIEQLQPVHVVPLRMQMESPEAPLEAMLAAIAQQKQGLA